MIDWEDERWTPEQRLVLFWARQKLDVAAEEAPTEDPFAMPLSPCTFPDGTRRVVRNSHGGKRLRFHYLKSMVPLATLCGAPVLWHEKGDTGDRYADGSPLPICARCKRLVGE